MKDLIKFFVLGVLTGLPVLALSATAARTVPGGVLACCRVAGVNCGGCQTYACCMAGCEAGRGSGTNNGGIFDPTLCWLTNCADGCASAFVTL